MRISIFLWAFGFFQCYAAISYGQDVLVSMRMEKSSVVEILKQIEKKTDLHFIYKTEDIAHDKNLDVDVKEKPVLEVLNEILPKAKLTYEIFDKYIAIKTVTGMQNQQQQQKTITGTVTDQNGESLPGVSVIVKGTAIGVSTDFDGNYTLTIPDDANVLVYSFIGKISQEVSLKGQSVINVVLEDETLGVEEVIVTALGIKKVQKTVGYSVQEVKGENLVKAPDINPVSSLSGKVSGLVIANSSNLFGDPSILLRGVSPLIVVDGVPVASDTWNLSPNDIESYSVLKGPAAAALYGSLGKNGAIQISTKRGTSDDRGFSVELNSSTMFQPSFLVVPKTQHEYGPGDGYAYDFGNRWDGREGVNSTDYNVWGPRFEGQLIRQYDSPVDPVTGERQPTPWLARGVNNLDNFLETGLITSNNVVISGQTDRSNVRFSATDTYQQGIIPNTDLNIAIFNFSGSLDLGEEKRYRLETSITFNKQDTKNYPSLEYSPQSPIYNLMIWQGADFDVRELRDYWYPGKEGFQQRNVEYTQYNNPYFVAYENLKGYHKDDIYGFVALNAKVTDELNFRVRTSASNYTTNRSMKWPVSGNFYGDKNQLGAYEESYFNFFESNSDFMTNYQRKLTDNFSIQASIGGNLRLTKTNQLAAQTKNGLLVPGLYTLRNSVEAMYPTNYSTLKQVASLYGYVDLEYKNMLYLSLTGRTDKSSTLPRNNNQFFYPSASLSAVISEMVTLPSFIAFLKLRTSYAKVGGDLAIYNLSPSYSIAGPAWDGNLPFTYSGQQFNPLIEPEFSTSSEVGMDIRFMKGRLGLDVAYYRNIDGPQIFNLNVPESSGYETRQVNGREYLRKGVEVTLRANPVKSKDIKWDVTMNWSTSQRFLHKLYGDETREGNIKVGERVDQVWIRDFMRSADGEIVYGTNGLPQRDPIYKFFGNYNNDWMAGMSNTVSYKNMTLNFAIDGRVGGLIFNYVDYQMWRSGTHPESATEYRFADWINRDTPGYSGTFVGDGVIVTSGELLRDPEGVVLSDTRTYKKNDVTAKYRSWAPSYYTNESNAYMDRSFIKLREVSLDYAVPAKVLSRMKMLESANISLIGRNLLYWGKAKYVDSDQFTGSRSQLQTPTMRNYGVKVKLIF
ncbi:SusC/RagA family TonB-linked outer membrane protein [Saccharicrinis sp. GN24d3]|uniref:SusC/RagA family TonB-linked outer membrane protein n=1 Tax=Saccharicrinis sp. GN24d3 TaxID=3458416 RepID=UPI0040363CF9